MVVVPYTHTHTLSLSIVVQFAIPLVPTIFASQHIHLAMENVAKDLKRALPSEATKEKKLSGAFCLLSVACDIIICNDEIEVYTVECKLCNNLLGCGAADMNDESTMMNLSR